VGIGYVMGSYTDSPLAAVSRSHPKDLSFPATFLSTEIRFLTRCCILFSMLKGDAGPGVHGGPEVL
jgi:hypothetical protein